MDLGYFFVFSLQRESPRLFGNVQLRKIFGPLIEEPGRLFIPTLKVFKMVEV